MKFLVLISIILSIKSTFGLNCYSCNSGTYPNCGDNMTNTTKIPIATCKTPNDFCVTFYNSFDNNNIYRGCSGSFIVPEGLDKIDTCVLDQYTKSVFCSCKTDYCNKGQMGNLEITKIDECLSSPCLNGATCVDLYNNYTCQCAQNFTGSTCEKCIPGNIGPDCSEVFDPCKNQPCQHGGTCQDDTKGSYICSCTTGWTDNECTTRINPCATYPCENGGECTDLEILDQFNCTCDGTGYQGNTCSQDIDECALSIDKCDNGTCSNTDGSYKCVCNPGFTGKLCDIDINECMPNPCKNGTCSNELNSYSCSCFPGFTGKNCELDINECTTQTCSGNGKCENLIASYRCNCNPGFTGKECETNIDECVSNPCLNSGICNDTVNGFICECVTGYNGTRCEYEINECSSNPCQNSGTCRNRIGSYSCACAPGFTGKNCETDIDECLPEPCNPAGSLNCTDKINGFECICDKGFFGPTCDDLVPPTPCNSNPCKNGGTCSNTIDGSKYICSCTNGFDGDDCSLFVQNFCIGVTCVNGNPVSNPDAKNCTCDCKPGFSGLMCEKENAQCTKVGTFPDPVYCWNYYTCTQGANGLIKDVFSCPIKQLSTGPLQLLFQFDPATQTGLCKFPSTFTSYSGITCSKN